MVRLRSSQAPRPYINARSGRGRTAPVEPPGCKERTKGAKDPPLQKGEEAPFGRMAPPGKVLGQLNFDPYCHDSENSN